MIGPVELNLLERVEYGLAISDQDSNSRGDVSCDHTSKFEGQREVIFVSGWANINQIFGQMRNAFFVKALIAVVAVLCFRFWDQRLWPVAAALLLHSLLSTLIAVRELYRYWTSDAIVRMPIIVDLNEGVCLQIYFLGFLLYLTGEMIPRPLPLFAVPGLVYSTLVFLYYSEESLSLSTRKFMVVEWVQLVLISLKVSGTVATTWNYTLFLFMAGAIYLAVLGIFLAMILACSVVGMMQGRLLGWKSRALCWMTWNYLSSGLAYIFLMKGLIHYYNDDGVTKEGPVVDIREFKNEEAAAVMVNSLVGLAAVSLVSWLPALLMKKDITRFLAKVVYKHEVRKEVSLRTISKSFTFKLIQASATYFLKPFQSTKEPKDEKVSPLTPSSSDPVAHQPNSAAPKNPHFEREPCFMCCEALPNTMLDPCGHGGVCKSCVVSYLKHQGERCPICKIRMERVFVLDYDEEDGQYITKGEIKLNS
jgi:hypothetical protein